MTTPLTRSIRRMLRSRPRQAPLHFHLHHDGRPYVCDFARCESPALTLVDIEEQSGS
jgi:hypothetical protein